MKDDLFLLEKSEIAREILAYLAEHPDAQDTIDGIVEWWLLKQTIKYQTKMVRKALEDLINKGFILEKKKGDSQVRYGINQSKYEGIRILLNKRPDDIKKE